MLIALVILAVQGTIGAFDTIYYHEWRARLPALGPAAGELKIHAIRDFFYAVLFGTLPWLAWQGAWLLVLLAIFAAEILLTMTDFVIEIRARKSLGDVFAGERITHATMAILYGAMIANLTPVLFAWWREPTGLVYSPAPVPIGLRWLLSAMAICVFVSGVRDLYASFGLPGGNWPWPKSHLSQEGNAQ